VLLLLIIPPENEISEVGSIPSSSFDRSSPPGRYSSPMKAYVFGFMRTWDIEGIPLSVKDAL
jgi:hypothetical protein